MATLSPYLDIPKHILLNPTLPLMLPRRFSDHSDAHFDEHEFQSNRLDSGYLSSNAAPSLSGLGIRNLDLSKDLESKGYFQDNPPVSHAQVSYGRRHRRRTPRVGSTYDILNESMDSVMKPLDNTLSMPSTWSFSSVIKAAELAADEAVHEMESTLSLDLGIGDLGTTSIFLDTEDQISWASEKLFATPGSLVSDFIAQISANDSILIQQYLDQAAQIHMDDGQQSQTTYNFQEEQLITSAATYPIPELSLPLAVDVDMHNANFNNPCIGVNPADILPALLSPTSLSNVPQYYSYLNDSLSTIEPTVDGDFFRQDNVADMEHPGFQAELEVMCQISHDIVLPALVCTDSKASKQASDDEHSVFHSPASSDYSPSPVLKPTSIKGNKRHRIVRTKFEEESDFNYSENYDDRHQNQGLDLPVDLGTPVLDAHRGIELEELKAKAERYRLRNQGRDYDKRWLISFAGKLSMRGELIEEFRCYITGCGQINKRRDHILIHVGAHLDQRPFKCRHWYVLSYLLSSSFLSDLIFYISSSRFLRKNECKRHELSHTGLRPYSCHLCPFPETTFVRQDLLKRHMKRTHRLDADKGEKENKDMYRPKKKARI